MNKSRIQRLRDFALSSTSNDDMAPIQTKGGQYVNYVFPFLRKIGLQHCASMFPLMGLVIFPDKGGKVLNAHSCE